MTWSTEKITIKCDLCHKDLFIRKQYYEHQKNKQGQKFFFHLPCARIYNKERQVKIWGHGDGYYPRERLSKHLLEKRFNGYERDGY